MNKTKLIYFNFNHRAVSMSHFVRFNDNLIIELQECITWLDIWFDKKLLFKTYVEKRTTSVIKMFHLISRLALTVKKLSFKLWESYILSVLHLYLIVKFQFDEKIKGIL